MRAPLPLKVRGGAQPQKAVDDHAVTQPSLQTVTVGVTGCLTVANMGGGA